MKTSKLRQSYSCQVILTATLSLSLNVAHAAYTYDYSTGAITLESLDHFNSSTSFPHLDEISNGQVVTASITLDEPLAANTTTSISGDNLIGFFTDSTFLSSALLQELITSSISLPDQLRPERRSASGQLTTDADGNIDSWNLSVGFLENDFEPIRSGSFNLNSSLTEMSLFPLTVNGEAFNSADDLHSGSENRNRYNFQSYDDIRSSSGDEENRIVRQYYTSGQGQWTSRDDTTPPVVVDPSASVPTPASIWLISSGLLGFLATYKRPRKQA